jgi:hypothetical protein
MLFGMLSVSLFGYVTYCWRHHFVNMMDSLTSFCWLSANLIWMGGEVFIRWVETQYILDFSLDTGAWSLMILIKLMTKLLDCFLDYSFCVEFKSK